MATRTSTTTSYETILNTLGMIPYLPQQQYAKGILPPIMRAAGHLLYLRADLANEQANFNHLTAEEQKNEVMHAREHLAGANLPVDLPTLSITAKNHIINLITGVEILYALWDGLSAEQRINAVASAAHRTSGLACFLDRELTGITSGNSDPGTAF